MSDRLGRLEQRQSDQEKIMDDVLRKLDTIKTNGEIFEGYKNSTRYEKRLRFWQGVSIACFIFLFMIVFAV